MFALAAGPRGPLWLPLVSCSSAPFFFFFLPSVSIALKRKPPGDLPSAQLQPPLPPAGAMVGSGDEACGVHPPLSRSKAAHAPATCLATITQHGSLSPVKEPVHEDPCAAVGDGGWPVMPVVGNGSVVQPSPDQRLLCGAMAAPSQSTRALKK